jgi:hypothetical protein
VCLRVLACRCVHCMYTHNRLMSPMGIDSRRPLLHASSWTVSARNTNSTKSAQIFKLMLKESRLVTQRGAATGAHLRRHALTHLSARTFKSPVCAQALIQAESLASQMRWLPGRPPPDAWHIRNANKACTCQQSQRSRGNKLLVAS